VAAGRGDLEGALDRILSADVAEVGIEAAFGAEQRTQVDLRRRDRLLATQKRDRIGESRHGDDLDALDHRRLACVRRRQQQAAQPPRAGGGSDRQGAAHRFHVPVGRELAEDGVVAQDRAGQRPVGGQDADGDRQIEGRPLLANVRRSEVHGHRVARHAVAGIAHRRAHAIETLADGALRQPDHGEMRQAGAGEVDLDLDQQPVDALQGTGKRGGQHGD
jgi:hypothetical protein